MSKRPKFYAGLYDSRKNTLPGDYLITAWNAWRRNYRKPPYFPAGCNVIVDCGAYSAYTSGVPIPFTLDEYVEFVRRVEQVANVTAVATIDVMNDKEQSEQNAKDAITRYPDIHWIATAQGKTDEECAQSAAYLETLNPAYIGIGCATVARQGGVKAVIRRINAVALAAPSKTIHLWGVGLKRAEALNHPSVASHDSSSWYPRTSNKAMRDEYANWQGTLGDYVNHKLLEYRQKLAQIEYVS